MNNDTTNNNAQTTGRSLGEVLGNMIQQLETSNAALSSELRGVSQATTNTVSTVASAVTGASTNSNNSSIGREVLNAINPAGSSRGTNILTSLFLGPVWRGIFSLFGGGGGEEAPPALTKYDFPEETRTDVAAGVRADGQPNGVRSNSFGLTQANPAPAAPIQISIQALDARSILDRSDDIAAALKQAMLSNHEINDSMNEL